MALMMINPRRAFTPQRRGFTLIEALVASTLLGIIVLAVMSAVAASQKLAFEGQKQILAAMAADDLMAELTSLAYDDLRLRDGLVQPIGELQTIDGDAYPGLYWALGRSVEVQHTTLTHQETQASVRGVRIRVRAFDDRRDVVVVEMFVPEPPA